MPTKKPRTNFFHAAVIIQPLLSGIHPPGRVVEGQFDVVLAIFAKTESARTLRQRRDKIEKCRPKDGLNRGQNLGRYVFGTGVAKTISDKPARDLSSRIAHTIPPQIIPFYNNPAMIGDYLGLGRGVMAHRPTRFAGSVVGSRSA
jgi:hypothetical protein